MSLSLVSDGAVRVINYRCEAGPYSVPFDEVHDRFSLSYVRRGSFGCIALGHQYDLIAGSFLLGFPGDEFRCTHEHHDGGDECLSIQIPLELAETLSARPEVWRQVVLPPSTSLCGAAEVALAAADGEIGISAEEAGLMLVARFVHLVAPERLKSGTNPTLLRGRMTRLADWLHTRATEPTSLEDAATEAGMSVFHFLRSFRAVTGVTPHQYLLRLRLAHAARLLARTDVPVTEVALTTGFGDLSNFIRTFGRAAGNSPGHFRVLTQGGLATHFRGAAGEREATQDRSARVCNRKRQRGARLD